MKRKISKELRELIKFYEGVNSRQALNAGDRVWNIVYETQRRFYSGRRA